MSNNSQGHFVRAVSKVSKRCVSREGRINMPDGVCRRRVNRNNDKNDIDLNPILEDEKPIMNVNDNEATIASTRVIKNKTIYQLSNSEFVSNHKKDKNVTVLAHVRTLAQVITSSYLGWPM